MKIDGFTGKSSLESALTDLTALELSIQQSEAKMNAKINDVKEKYEIETFPVRTRADEIKLEIEAFCLQNKKEFEKKKSMEFTSGVVGFRTTTPKVATLNRKYTFKTALELVKRVFKKQYIRAKEELDKEAILADYSAKKVDDQKLSAVGLRVDQEENFYIEPKLETLNR
jgi:phage host-nuclease inhibitor protein Gam